MLFVSDGRWANALIGGWWNWYCGRGGGLRCALVIEYKVVDFNFAVVGDAAGLASLAFGGAV